jgi:hypothetical protein
MTQHYNVKHTIITLYEFFEWFLNCHNIVDFLENTKKHVTIHN